jgi:glycosyltransferase involved in cell wall biosynthesis
VDDGSPDRCPDLCDALGREDDRIRVVHKENGGLASARNAGMRIACGKYLFFLDSDDWIDSNALEELTDTAEREGTDFVRFRPMYAGWPGKEDGSLCDFGTEKGMREGLYDRERIRREIFPRLFATPELTLGVIVAAWRSLYRLDFLRETDLWFDESVRYSEDTIFSARLVAVTDSFYYLDGPRYYHYFYNPGSITRSFRKDRWDSCRALMTSFEREFGNFEGCDFSDQLWLQKIYCIASAMGQRKALSDRRERKKWCAMICSDPVTREAMGHLGLLRVPWKQRIELELIHLGMADILAFI